MIFILKPKSYKFELLGELSFNSDDCEDQFRGLALRIMQNLVSSHDLIMLDGKGIKNEKIPFRFYSGRLPKPHIEGVQCLRILKCGMRRF